MSNASNLSTLANVLDDGSDGQFLKSTGSGGVAFAAVAAGAVVYATADLLPLSGFAAGDMAYVTATNRFYINNGSGWYSISLVNTNPNITSVADASSGTTPFTLATDQTATVITITAADPEEVPLTYGYSVTSGSLNGSTVAQGTGSNTNVFTVTPHASQDATFTITFTASDGINQATSANAFSLSFITIVADSNHTTLLATATSTGANSTIVDSSTANSGNPYSITVNNDAYAGSFSPYRSGGYSTYFDGTGDYLITTSSNYSLGTSSAFTLEFWYYFDEDRTHTIFDFYNSSSGAVGKLAYTSGNVYLYDGSANILALTRTQVVGSWEHFCWTRDASNNHVFYINGTQVGTSTASTNIDSQTLNFGRRGGSFNGAFMKGYLSDVRLVKGTVITPPSGGPTERLEAVTNTSLLTCHLPYIADGSTNDHSITLNGDVSTKPFSPYDYEEYDAADYGGSVYFGGGTREHLSTSLPAFGTQDFEVEFWIYGGGLTSTTWYTLFSRNYNVNGSFRIYCSGSGSGADKFIYIANGTEYNYTSAGKIKDNVWNHILLSRVSGTAKWFINGIADTSWSDSENMTSTATLYIGDTGADETSNSSYPFEGYMSDIAIRMGGSGYRTSSFTPPTAPLSSSGAELHLKGTDASIIDKSQGANLKLIGTTTGSTDQVRTGNWANTKTMYFDGNSDYITIADDEAYGFGTGDWTIETWLYCTKTGGFNAIFDTRVGTGTQTGNFGIGMYTTGRVQLFSGGIFYYPTDTLSFNTWQHLAVVKNSGTTKMYFNGTAASTTYSDSRDYGSSQPVQIGKDDTTSNYFGGYMQDFRITKGKARYTANFTPPTAPLEG